MRQGKTASFGSRAFLLGVFGIIAAIWYMMSSMGYGSDMYYMIAEGRRILDGGIQYANASAWDPGHAMVLQNWASCAALAWLERLSGAYGIYVFYGPFAVGAAACMYVGLGRYVKSRIMRGLLAMAGVIVGISGMWTDMRGGNLTLVLAFLQCWSFTKYRDTKKIRCLALQPALVILEINLHGAMWPIHFCILAAYAVPPLLPGKYADTRSVGPTGALACGASMAVALFCNPYGMSMVTYPFDCMAAFRTVSVPEQGPVQLSGLEPVIIFGLIAGVILLAMKRMLGSSELYLCLGLLALSCLKQHGWMFLPLVYVIVIGRAVSRLDFDMDALVPPKDILKLGFAMCAICLVLAGAALLAVKSEMAHPGVSDMAEHIKSGQADHGGNIVGCVEISSFLEYSGASGLFWDGRIELLSGGLNKCHDMGPEKIFMSTGVMDGALENKYADLDEYLDANHVRYIADYASGPEFPYLIGWVSKSPDWVMLDGFGTDDFILFERAGS